MRKIIVPLAAVACLLITSCSSDDYGIDKPAVTATCTDGIQNSDETSVDCGGTCDPCETGTENPIENPATYAFERDESISSGICNRIFRTCFTWIAGATTIHTSLIAVLDTVGTCCRNGRFIDSIIIGATGSNQQTCHCS